MEKRDVTFKAETENSDIIVKVVIFSFLQLFKDGFKRSVSILFFILISLHPIAQTPQKLAKEPHLMGENLITGEKIYVDSYILPGKIFSFFVDSISNQVWFELKNLKSDGSVASRGTLQAYDLNTMSLKWQKKVNYMNGQISIFENCIMQNTRKNYRIYDSQTGETKYTSERDVQYVLPELNIGLGYIYLPEHPYTLEAFELHTGRVLWRRKVPRNDTWNEVILQNDSTILISSKGLHSINLYTGMGWNSDVESSPLLIFDEGNTNQILASMAVGFFAGAIGAVIVPPVSNRRKILIDKSKILLHNDVYHVITNHNITALDKLGNKIWSAPVPVRMISRTRFFIFENNIILFNFNSDELLDETRRSFLASFKAETGEQNYINFLRKDSPDKFIQHFKINGNYFDVLYRDKIDKLDLRTGEIAFSKPLTDEQFLYFPGDTIYVSKSGTMVSLKNNSDNIYIYSSSGKILEFNQSYERQQAIISEDFYVLLFSFVGGRVVQNKDETLILNEKNQKVSKIEWTKNAVFENETFYFFDQNKFYLIEKSELIRE